MKEETFSRREREKLNHRNQILDVAIQLFSERGYRNVSMYEIATKAEFSIGTLYNFFKNKEDLYGVLMIEKAEELSRIIDEVLSKEDDVRNIIRELIAAEARFIESNLALIRLYFTETQGSSFNFRAGFDQQLSTIDNKMIKKVASALEEGIRSNVLRKIDPHHLSVALRGLISGFLFCRLEDLDRNPFEDNASLIAELFLKGCLADE